MIRAQTVDGGRIAGSFRDPAGFVFEWNGRIFRAIDAKCAATLRALQSQSLWESLIQDGTLIETEFVDEPEFQRELSAKYPGYTCFLEHKRLSLVSYPYEWSLSMLADAGLRTLDLQLRLLEVNCSLKDATAFNVQFVGSRPVFIDVASIERPSRLDVWFALAQFNRMFLFPLLLCRHRGWDLRSYFLANPNGREPEQVVRVFGALERWRPSLLLDVTLPWLLTRRAQEVRGDGRSLLDTPNQNANAQLMNLRRLRSKVTKLAETYAPSGIWADYVATCNYDDAAETEKKELVSKFLTSARPQQVLDIGCNTGDYSYLAAKSGAEVVAIDQDHDAVELLYRRLRREPAAITPLVADITNPSPGIGLRNEERLSFRDRIRPDCVLALAVLHHLLVSGNLSLSDARDLLFDLTADYLLLEFVPTDDSMFQKLIKFRVNLFGEVSLDRCRELFGERFDILCEKPIRGSKRTLLWMRKK